MKRILALIIIFTVLGFCRTATPVPQYRPFQIVKHNINNVEMCVSNYGKFGQTEAGNSGLFWPKGSGNTYIFGAGSWFGTIDGTDTLVTIGYGPHGGESEYVPGLATMSSGDPNAIIFLYPSPWPPPADVYQMAPQVPKSHQDSWCAYNDLDINQHMPGDTRPIGLEVYQTVYAWNLSTTRDIIFVKVELKNVSGKKLTNCYFGICTDNDIGNEAGQNANDIISGIVGQWYVINGESLWVDNLGYQYQKEWEQGWLKPPGAIGFDYLQSPWDLKEGQDKDNDGIPDQHERDSAYYAGNVPQAQWDVDGDGTPDWRDPSEIPQLGMTAFKRFTLNLEPNKDNERYVTLAGYNFKTGEYTPFDTAPPQPDDQRFLQCSGPFDLDPDSIATVLVGIMLVDWPYDQVERPDTQLAKLDQTVQYIYDMNWLLPGPPPPPKLTCVPGDGKVTLIWDNTPETAPDPYYDVVSNPQNPQTYDPYYKKYDFEGYRIWKSPTGKTGTWSLIASFDLANGITFKDPEAPDSIALQATDAGLAHSFVDTDVRNGFGYYYAVTSFDYNFVKDYFDSIYVVDSHVWIDTIVYPDTVIIDTFIYYYYDTVKVAGPRPIYFESGLTGVVAVPRREPANYKEGNVQVEWVTGNPRLTSNVNAKIVYPLNMKTDEQYLRFGPIVRVGNQPQYSTYLLDKDRNPVDSFKLVMPVDSFAHQYFYEFKEVNGVSVTPWFIKTRTKGSVVIFSEVVKESGTYPDSLIRLDATAAGWPINWAYRGNDFRVIWKKKDPSGVVNTVVVVDMMTGDTIPYRPYFLPNNAVVDSLADGWCFVSLSGSTDTLVYSNQPNLGTRYLYICSGKIGISKTWMKPGHPRPSENDVWVVKATTQYAPAPFGAEFKIVSQPAVLLDSVVTLNVKVVPNPYLVYNEWQQSSLIRRLRFINLPSDCVIRIFTLNGDLVKTIVHKATVGSVQGDAGGDEWWDLLTDNRQLVASGVYVFHVDSKVGQQTGKFVIIR
ncbi:MAG: hypothetical protein ABIL39_06055 [candidate division WOR-3 bacterium]